MNIWIDFDKVPCHSYYQGAGKFGGGFLGSVGRQKSETEGKLYYYLTKQQAYMVSEWKYFHFENERLEDKKLTGN